MSDDLERVFRLADSTRIVTIMLRPGEAKDHWDMVVDYDDWMSPYEAYAMVYRAYLKVSEDIGIEPEWTEGQEKG